MQLKFKLTDTRTGEDITPVCESGFYVIDPEDGQILYDPDPLCGRDKDTSHITARLFTGFCDTDDNEIYDSDVLADQYGQARCTVYFGNGTFMVRFADERQTPMMLMFYMLICGCAFVAGNRWQPEFKEVFGDA